MSRRTRLLRAGGWLLLLAVALGLSRGVGAATIIADLSDREVAITTGFTGAELLLFGTTEGPGDIIVTIEGPRRNEIVRRKTQVAGIWVNGNSVTFRNAPAYYRVAASRNLDQIAPTTVLAQLGIGTGSLDFKASTSLSPQEEGKFREALFRNKRRLGLYGEAASGITVKEGRLFRTSIPFPATVPTGDYLASIYLFRDGRLVTQEQTPLTVRKDGLEARLFSFAHEQSALYGVVAILIALLSGWLAGLIFRRV